jgi:cbb3-type cytochrome oxidase maturation protein
MTSLIWLILLSLVLGFGALMLFLWALRSGQYDDMDGAASRVLFDDNSEAANPCASPPGMGDGTHEPPA